MAVTNAPARESPGRHITHGRGFFLRARGGFRSAQVRQPAKTCGTAACNRGPPSPIQGLSRKGGEWFKAAVLKFGHRHAVQCQRVSIIQ